MIETTIEIPFYVKNASVVFFLDRERREGESGGNLVFIQQIFVI